MAKQNSFDVVSATDLNEVRNAIQLALKEVRQRFDFKGSVSDISLEAHEIVLRSDDEFKLRALVEVLEQKMVRRSVSLRALTYEKVENAAGGTVRQRVLIQQGIPTEKAREITKAIRDSKLRVQAAIQGDTVRVSGRDRDTLQKVITMLKEMDFGIDMHFENFRSH